MSPPPPKAKATPLRGTGLRWSLRSTSSRPGTHPRPCAPAVLSVHGLCPAPGPHLGPLSPSLWLSRSPPPALDSSSACQEAGPLPCCVPTRSCSPRAPPPALGTARPAPACPTGAGGCPSSSLTWGRAPGTEAAAGPPGSPDTTEDEDACFICLRTGAHTLLLQHGGIRRLRSLHCGPTARPLFRPQVTARPGVGLRQPYKGEQSSGPQERACPPGSLHEGPFHGEGPTPWVPRPGRGLLTSMPGAHTARARGLPPASRLHPVHTVLPGDAALLRPSRSPLCSLLSSE